MRLAAVFALFIAMAAPAMADSYTMAFLSNGQLTGASFGLTDDSGARCQDGSSLRSIDLCPLPQRFYVCESSYRKIMSQLGSGHRYQIRNTSISGYPQVC